MPISSVEKSYGRNATSPLILQGQPISKLSDLATRILNRMQKYIYMYRNI